MNDLDELEKVRTAVYIPNWMLTNLRDLSNTTGKSMNSMIIDGIIDYLERYEESHRHVKRLFKGGRNER